MPCFCPSLDLQLLGLGLILGSAHCIGSFLFYTSNSLGSFHFHSQLGQQSYAERFHLSPRCQNIVSESFSCFPRFTQLVLGSPKQDAIPRTAGGRTYLAINHRPQKLLPSFANTELMDESNLASVFNFFSSISKAMLLNSSVQNTLISAFAFLSRVNRYYLLILFRDISASW